MLMIEILNNNRPQNNQTFKLSFIRSSFNKTMTNITMTNIVALAWNIVFTETKASFSKAVKSTASTS